MVYAGAKIYLGWPISLFLRKVKGEENFPKPPFIVAANHASYLDDIIVPYLIVRKTNTRFHMMVNSRFYKNPFLRAFFRHFGCIKVDVGKDVKDEKKRKKTNEEAFQKAFAALKKGEIVGIFPEGGRSPDGKLKEPKLGIAKVTLRSGLPVVPLAIKESHRILPRGALFPRFKRTDVTIGKPMTFEHYHGKEDRESYQIVAKKIMDEIARLRA
jgi:1-acyl-sn-glycerol-3-phosphate acyltransferase